MHSRDSRLRGLIAGGVFVAMSAAGCGGGGGHGGPPPGPPVISNVNGATEPTTPKNVLMEINGSLFLGGPGSVGFQQGATTVSVTPLAASWSDATIAVLVPASLSAPGSVTVTVTTAGGTSNPVSVSLVATPNFSPSNVVWETPAAGSNALPRPIRGHRAVGVPKDSTSGFIYVIGGNEGGATTNTAAVLSNTIDDTATLGATWTEQANALPAARALHAVALAESTNSLVPTGTAFVYVVGGQEAANGAPGGVSTVYVASVDRSTGTVGAWAATSPLPDAVVGARAVVANGFLYVTGGYNSNGTALATVRVAEVKANGTLGAFGTSASILPSGVAFHQSLAFGGFLYVLMGENGPSTTPYSGAPANFTGATYFAQIRRGSVGAWTATATSGTNRAKHEVLAAFGQVLVEEGLVSTSLEGQRSSIGSDGTLSPWNGQTGGAVVGLDTFHTAGLVSPVLAANGNPRFLLLGGEKVPGAGTGLVSTIKRTTAP